MEAVAAAARPPPPRATSDAPRRMVIVMMALKDFSVEPLEWVLKSIPLNSCSTITLLGVKPYLNIPLTSRTGLAPVWTLNLEDLSTLQGISEWEFKSSVKYQNVRQIIDLCQKKGVALQVKNVKGYPLRQTVTDRLATHNATLVVLVRHHDRKTKEYYAKKVECNIVKMEDCRAVDIIKLNWECQYSARESSSSSAVCLEG